MVWRQVVASMMENDNNCLCRRITINVINRWNMNKIRHWTKPRLGYDIIRHVLLKYDDFLSIERVLLFIILELPRFECCTHPHTWWPIDLRFITYTFIFAKYSIVVFWTSLSTFKSQKARTALWLYKICAFDKDGSFEKNQNIFDYEINEFKLYIYMCVYI